MNKRAKSNSIRIISGQWRGRRLEVLNAEGLRPTTDRVRETLFNWLMYETSGARCLDLFAGTGVLGLESLSRGAEFVDFVEKSGPSARAIDRNLSVLGASSERARVQCMDAIEFLKSSPRAPYDLVFLDPPFAMNILQSIIVGLSESGWLAPECFIYIEQDSTQSAPAVPDEWSLHREGRAGQSNYRLYSLGD